MDDRTVMKTPEHDEHELRGRSSADPVTIICPLALFLSIPLFGVLTSQVAAEARTVPPPGARDDVVKRHRLAKMVNGKIDRKVHGKLVETRHNVMMFLWVLVGYLVAAA